MNVPSPTRGASLRAPSSEDAPAITALLDSIQRTLHGSSDVTEDRVRFVWRWPRFDLARDARMAFVEGALAGYAWIWGPRDPEPDWDGGLAMLPDVVQVVGDPLLDWMEARVREQARTAGDTRPPRLAVPSSSVGRAKPAFLLGRGYALVRTYLRMTRALEGAWDAPIWPADVAVDVMRAGEDDRDLHRVIDDSFAEHYRIAREPFEQWRRRTIDHVDFAPELSFLVRREGEVIAASANFRAGDEGTVGMLGVRKAWRRLGLGRALLLRSFDAFRDAGLSVARLGVDAGNADRAVALYESVGMTVEREDLLFERTL